MPVSEAVEALGSGAPRRAGTVLIKSGLSSLLGRAMISARAGWMREPAPDAPPSGDLFMRELQAEIAARLEPERLERYIGMRDAVRDAVRLAREGELAAAGKAFEACAARLPDFADDSELDDLARVWLDQGWAYFEVRRKNLDAAEARLRRAMDDDTRLEQVHGYELMHLGRIHTAHLWLRVRAAAGDRDGALDGANDILAYLDGASAGPPLGGGWSRQAAARIPPELAAVMIERVVDEFGVMLGGLDQKSCVAALDRLPALRRLDPARHGDAAAWTRIKTAWAEGESHDFLAGAAPFLAAGRRRNSLWHAALLDLCRAARVLRPRPAETFCAEVAARAKNDAAPPRELRPHFAALAGRRPAAPWAPRAPARRFHLVCVGLPRSGVHSLYSLFRDCRAAYEYADAETVRALIGRGRGEIDNDGLRRLLRRRDRESGLEMDAATFLHLAVAELADLSGETRFIFPVREPAEWFASYLDELARWGRRLRAQGKQPKRWQRDYAEMLFSGAGLDQLAAGASDRAALDGLARRFLSHWADTVRRVLDALPPRRALFLRTRDLGPMRERIAAFVDQPAGILTGEHHSNIRPSGPSALDGLPRDWLDPMVEEICGAARAEVLDRCVEPRD